MKQFIPRNYFFIFLGFSAITAIFLVNLATPAGAGLANDSTAYIAGARSLLNGTGYSDIWLMPPFEPITHYPPLYSIFLALGGLLGIDPLRGTRALNMVLFGLNSVLVGLFVWRATRKPIFAIWATLVFELGAMFLRIHTYAMSESVFIFMMLASLHLSLKYFDDRRVLWLAFIGLFSGFAVLTRYSGLALLPPITVGLIFSTKHWKDQIKITAIYIGSVVITVLPWFVRNSLIAGNATNRSLQYHPITGGNIDTGIYNLSHLLIPIESIRQPIFKSGLWPWMLGVGFGLACLVALGLFIKLWGTKKREDRNVVSFMLLAVFVTYFFAIFFSMSFFDNSTKLQDRIIAPGYLAFILFLGIAAANWLRKNERWKAYILIALGLVTVYFSVSSTIAEARILSSEGLGYANWKYRDNPIIAALAEYPEDVTIFTNSPPAVYLTIGKATQVMPTSVDPVSNTERGGYTKKLSDMESEILSGDAVLAIFNLNDFASTHEYTLIEPLIQRLNVVIKGGDAVLFSK